MLFAAVFPYGFHDSVGLIAEVICLILSQVKSNADADDTNLSCRARCHLLRTNFASACEPTSNLCTASFKGLVHS